MSGIVDGDVDSAKLDSYILRLLDESRDEIKLSDSKASIVFAAVAAFSGFLATSLADGASMLRTSGDVVVALAIIAIAALVAAMVVLGLAIIPRLGRPEPGRSRYFVEQAQFATGEALLSALSVDARNPSDRHAQQLLILSRIAQRKYRHLRDAMKVICVAIAVLGVAAVAAGIG